MQSQNFIDLTLNLEEAFEYFGKYRKTDGGLTPVSFGHVGTHIDVMDYPQPELKRFISRGYLIDTSGAANLEITIQDTGLLELPIEKGDSIIFRTGWLSTTYGQGPVTNYFENHPFLSYEIINYLLEKQVNFIGMDLPAARQGKEHKEIDMYCANEGYIF